ncbi:hypothetical protein [Aliiruegeria lutimaris]|uniref:Uncharacterized protein n=1 Tax=Aliiruegeria lutimaris TaxID=571298 RepID=A0A1G9LYE6_9RHOB|nr:hypothetical protein [Aliiruegeria lutimaris]SDL66943.1 hypothetical protein SAMN04488026_11037 [Aliiruegeria lutimaris]
MFSKQNDRRYRRRPTLMDHIDATDIRKRNETASAELERYRSLLPPLVL